MIMIAAARLLFTARQIDSKDMHPGTGTRLDIALALLLALLGGSLCLYLSHAVVAAF
jgi:hypothetical protein